MPVDNLAYDNEEEAPEEPVEVKIQDLFPNAPKEAITQEIDRFKSDNPKATDADLLKVAESKAQPTQDFNNVLNDVTSETPAPAAQVDTTPPPAPKPSDETFTPQPTATPIAAQTEQTTQGGLPSFQQGLESYWKTFGTPENHPLRRFLAGNKGVIGGITRAMYPNATETPQEQAEKNLLLLQHLESVKNQQSEAQFRNLRNITTAADLERKQKEFELKHPAEARDPNSDLAKAATISFKEIADKAGLPQLSALADKLSFDQKANVMKNMGMEKIYSETMANQRAAAALAEKRQGKEDKQKNLGLDTLNKKMAEEAADWTLKGGFAPVKSSIAAFTNVADQLEKNPNLPGSRLWALASDKQRAIFNQNAGAIEQQVQGAIFPSLKSIFQRVTQGEMQAVSRQAYNPALPAATNARNLRDLADKLIDQAKAKQASITYFQNNNNSMEGYNGPVYDINELFKPSSGSTKSSSGTQGTLGTNSKEVDVILPNGKPGRIPREKLDSLIKAGGKLR